jgi:hypothetical protein
MNDYGPEWYDDSWRGAKRGNWQQTLWSCQRMCVPRIPERMTWVLKYNKEFTLQIGASSDCANICSRATFHAREKSAFTRPWSTQSCSTAVRRGCWPKERRINCLNLRGRFSERLCILARHFGYLARQMQFSPTKSHF